jgi:hypothetical protein
MRSVPLCFFRQAQRLFLPKHGRAKEARRGASPTFCDSWTPVSSALFDHFESREAEGFDGIAQLPIANQNIICVESADGKNAYIGLRQRHSDRNKAPDKIQVEWADNLESSPASTHLDSGGDEVILTYHRKFIPGTADREERFTGSPLWNWSMAIQSTHCKPFCQNDQLYKRRTHGARNMALKVIQCQGEF